MTALDRSMGDWAMTGAGGSVASVLRPGLARHVDTLRLIDAEPIEAGSPREVVLHVDVRDLAALEAAVAGCRGIVHLAAIADEAPFEELLAVNIAGTHRVFEAARRTGVRRVIFASSNHVTGMHDSTTLVDASMPPRPDSLYAVTKIAGEALGRMYADKFGLEVACVRIGSSVATPREPRHRHTWLSNRDLIAAFVAAMEAPALDFCVFYGSSANQDGFWDLEAGRHLGFYPVDDASTEPGPGGEAYRGRQGGEFVEADYTLRHLGKG